MDVKISVKVVTEYQITVPDHVLMEDATIANRTGGDVKALRREIAEGEGSILDAVAEWAEESANYGGRYSVDVDTDVEVGDIEKG